jgi:hypothetical protein
MSEESHSVSEDASETAVETSRARQIKSWYAAKAKEWAEKAAAAPTAVPPSPPKREAAQVLLTRLRDAFEAIAEQEGLGPLTSEYTHTQVRLPNRTLAFAKCRIIVHLTNDTERAVTT